MNVLRTRTDSDDPTRQHIDLSDIVLASALMTIPDSAYCESRSDRTVGKVVFVLNSDKEESDRIISEFRAGTLSVNLKAYKTAESDLRKILQNHREKGESRWV